MDRSTSRPADRSDAATGGAVTRPAVWEMPWSTVAQNGYALVTRGPRGPSAVPDGRCGLGLVNGVAWWFGPQSRPWLPDRQGVRVVGVRLALLAGRPVAGQSLDRWRDRRAPLAQLWGTAAARQVTDRCRAAADEMAVVDVLAGEATARAGEPDPVTVVLAALLDGDLPVGQLAARLGMSPRGVHRLCVDAFGLPPSVLRRIARLHRAARLGQATGRRTSLADLAHAAGYADQAHLSRELRALAGLTPRAAFS